MKITLNGSLFEPSLLSDTTAGVFWHHPVEKGERAKLTVVSTGVARAKMISCYQLAYNSKRPLLPQFLRTKRKLPIGFGEEENVVHDFAGVIDPDGHPATR